MKFDEMLSDPTLALLVPAIKSGVITTTKEEQAETLDLLIQGAKLMSRAKKLLKECIVPPELQGELVALLRDLREDGE